MTFFDLPDTPDNVNNINSGKYIASVWICVPICRRRPVNKNKQKKYRLD